jgi:membrane-associated phospholipid phosphatase
MTWDRRTALVIGVAAGGFLALALAVIGHARWLSEADAGISAAAYRTASAHPLWRSTMLAVTATGSTTVLGPLTAVGCLVLLRLRRWSAAVLVAVGLPVTLGLRLILVATIARPRPADRLAPAAGWSFPSGHTTASATVALIAVLVMWPWARTRVQRALLVGPAVLWAAAVGLSRVALVVHWPSDVAGGWLLALAVVTPLAAVVCRLNLRPASDR